MNKKTLRLTLDLDFFLLAITSHVRDYRLCHMLNTKGPFNFKKIEDYTLSLLPEGPTYFSRYYDYWETTENEVYFLSNRGSDAYLLPEMNRIDYLILIKGFTDPAELQEMLNKINRIDEVLAVISVDPIKIRSRENLIF